MFVRCPHCQFSQAISIDELRNCWDLLVCSGCGRCFDALPRLSAVASDGGAGIGSERFSEVTAGRSGSPSFWGYAALAMLVLLIGQMFYFEGAALSNRPSIRSILAAVCSAVHCQLPAYRNLKAMTFRQLNLQAGADRSYLLSGALSNHGLFPQAVPNLRLTLTDLSGNVIAERVFWAEQYFESGMLYPDQTKPFRLQFAAPTTSVAGYALNLL
ncbi:DUF3426 domain-containing protein [Methylomonas sp. MED-D]|uniref:DUF3426 domain-containing protein n=1 Tax=unclassified Methylomonas TaxID=2608980 RepID=UPI0028A3224B|nr:DUF3426 domain-containing protein [Methylomonas sp. MV1]MDT4330965.1 DUF3426 domain-containing protein [Methylomonas sp. MV1]